MHLCTLVNVLQEAQASVLQCLLRLLPDIRPEGVQEDLLIGALLFSGLPYQKPFTGDVAASQVRARALLS